MLTLDTGNVLLKPSDRRQWMHWLKRVFRLGQRLGNFSLHIKLRRVGRFTHVHANAAGRSARFSYQCHSCDWRDAARDVVRTLAIRLANQRDRLIAA
jgi:hypothetical protein